MWFYDSNIGDRPISTWFSHYKLLFFLTQLHTYPWQSWKKLHVLNSACADISFRIEDILVQNSRKYVAILDLSGDFEANVKEWGW